MCVSQEKTVAIASARISVKRSPLIFAENLIPYVPATKFLGFVIDKNLTWTQPIKHLKNKLGSACNVLHCLTGSMWGKSYTSMLKLQKALINSLLRYSIPVFHSISETNTKSIQTKIQWIDSNMSRRALWHIIQRYTRWNKSSSLSYHAHAGNSPREFAVESST